MPASHMVAIFQLHCIMEKQRINTATTILQALKIRHRRQVIGGTLYHSRFKGHHLIEKTAICLQMNSTALKHQVEVQ